jgi:hypothetical protein
MGNHNIEGSKFADRGQWVTLAQTAKKELLQNKGTRVIVEKHHLEDVDPNLLQQDKLIYDWRKASKTIKQTI